MLNQLQVNFLRQVGHNVAGIIIDTLKAECAQEVEKDEALEPLLEFRPEGPVRQLFATLAQ